jgi:glycosyltransferase involved in cell wall biosynthesis
MWGIPVSCKPRVIRTHGPDIVFLPLIGIKPGRLKAHFERVSLRKAEAIVSITRYMSEQIAAVQQNKQSAGQIETIIYNMVDVQAYSPSDDVRRDPLSVASVATLTRRKGVYQLLEAWRIVKAAVPKARLTFYGRDTNVAGASVLAELQALTAEYNLTQSVTFAGAVPVKEVVNVLHREGIIVYPSYIEAGPLAWLEAMATASPVIASTRGPGPEIIEEGVTGLLIDPDNVSQLADRIIALLKNPAQGEKLGRTARHEVVRRFSFETIIPQNIEFFESLSTQ